MYRIIIYKNKKYIKWYLHLNKKFMIFEIIILGLTIVWIIYTLS